MTETQGLGGDTSPWDRLLAGMGFPHTQAAHRSYEVGLFVVLEQHSDQAAVEV